MVRLLNPDTSLNACARTTTQAPETKQLALPLLILLAQQKRLITLQSGYSHLKLVAELYDSCQETLLQYIDFLQTAQTPTEYAAMLPSIQARRGPCSFLVRAQRPPRGQSHPLAMPHRCQHAAVHESGCRVSHACSSSASLEWA